MPPSSASGELWGYHMMPHELTVDILLPNGLIISLQCSRDTTLRNIKQGVWKEAKRYPLFHTLQPPSTYTFVVIVQDGEREELFDESRRLCELRLFWPVLSLVEPVGNREEKSLSYDIGMAIGRPLYEFDESRDPEVVQCRLNFLESCQHTVQERTSKTGGMDFYTIPCDIVAPQQLSSSQRSNNSPDLLICVWTDTEDGAPSSPTSAPPSSSAAVRAQKLTLKIPPNATPADIIREVVMRRSRKLSNGTIVTSGGGKAASKLTAAARSSSMAVDQMDHLVDQYVLKVAGCQLYFLESIAIMNYTYIQKCAQSSKMPQIMVMSRGTLTELAKSWQFITPSFVKRQGALLSTSKNPPTGPDGQQLNTLWEVDMMLKLKVISASSINIGDMDKIYVRVGIYHGAEPLCVKDTAPVLCSDPRWNEVLEFDLYIPDIPHAAQICFALCSIKQKKQKEEQHYPLAWANLRMIDYMDILLHGKKSLHLWSFPKSFDGYLNPLGHTGTNPSRDMSCLEVEFESFEGGPVVFPPKKQIEDYVRFITNWHVKSGNTLKMALKREEVTETDIKLFNDIRSRDPLHEMSEQEKEMVWRLRKYCQIIPDALPRLLDAVRWSSREEVAQMYILLDDWSLVKPESAMELLDIKYPDQTVRSFAVKSLDANLTDEQLSLYLISLVQVLKYEPFLDNDLSKFLLKRALRNQRIGHVFFWLLRSELVQTSNWTRFGLLIEAYCRGCGHYLKSLLRQVEATEKLTLLANSMKDKRDDPQKTLFEQINEPDYLDALQNLESPLDSAMVLGALVQEECRVMTSAKRPLWLVWKNPDPLAELLIPTQEILFKSGDDLRQDMLTLQMLKIMDTIWKADGRDFHLTPYSCLPMGKNIGMIEIVKKSKTILEIQSSQSKIGAFNIGSSSLLHKWLKLHNKGEKYEQSVDRFTRSCAGYCVATFVLGIRDRHQSNIMITEDGRIFHIDFGHFLGHYKKKFGISRERVPFVLTEDFIRVIAKGADNPRKSKEFESFQRLCGEAYIHLRRHAHLFITLFTMMLCMGIPELQKLEDIHYLRRTLAVDKKDEQQALQYFNEQLNDAYEGGWTTKVDWFFHSVRHL